MTLETPPTQPPAPAPAPRACPRCGAGLAPDQEWCLNCGADVGARVAGRPSLARPRRSSSARCSCWRSAAVALALVELADDDQQVAQAPPARSAPTPTPTPPAAPTGEQPAPGEAGATPGATVPEASDDVDRPAPAGHRHRDARERGRLRPTPTGRPRAPAAAPGATGTGSTGTIASWPSGKTAWTVILESATSQERRRRQGATSCLAGGTTVGVLHSDDFSSLNKGYWVVFSGTYDSKSAADSALDGLKATVSQAYVRHVVPR